MSAKHSKQRVRCKQPARPRDQLKPAALKCFTQPHASAAKKLHTLVVLRDGQHVQPNVDLGSCGLGLWASSVPWLDAAGGKRRSDLHRKKLYLCSGLPNCGRSGSWDGLQGYEFSIQGSFGAPRLPSAPSILHSVRLPGAWPARWMKQSVYEVGKDSC